MPLAHASATQQQQQINTTTATANLHASESTRLLWLKQLDSELLHTSASRCTQSKSQRDLAQCEFKGQQGQTISELTENNNHRVDNKLWFGPRGGFRICLVCPCSWPIHIQSWYNTIELCLSAARKWKHTILTCKHTISEYVFAIVNLSQIALSQKIGTHSANTMPGNEWK